MRFSPPFLDELRARLPVSAVVGRKVRLKKEGREWRGLSPFTSEKTPSFFVNDQKGRWFDFSAGKNGNIFDFIMETEGLSFPEAVEKLAHEAGLALPVVSREDAARDQRRGTVLDAMEEAARFFEAQLHGREGDTARAYLDGRGMGDAIQREFRIGLASKEKFALRDHLAGRDIDRDTMIEGGLLIHGEDIQVPYDRFRDRIMFPICDRSGRVIAFGGRTLDPAAIAGDVSHDKPAVAGLHVQQRHHVAKYLNSPETALFVKGAGLYNHHRARKAAHHCGRVISVEGYVDAIALAAVGFPETVASLGTALTTDQCALLWSMAEEPILCFDGDKAGRKAADRALDTALPLISGGRTLRFALLPEGLDPDDLARSGGAQAVQAVISSAKPLVEILWSRERDMRPLETPEHRTNLLERLNAVTEAIADRPLRQAYQSELRSRAFDHFRELRPQRPPSGRGPGRGPGASTTGSRPVVSESLARSALFTGVGGGVSARVAFILTSLLEYPELIAPHVEEIAALSISAPDIERVRQVLLHHADDDAPDRATVHTAIDAAACRPALEKLIKLAGPVRIKGQGATTNYLDAEVALRQALALQRREAALNSDLRVAEIDLAADPNDRNFQRLRDLRAQLSNFDGMDASLDSSDGASSRRLFGR